VEGRNEGRKEGRNEEKRVNTQTLEQENFETAVRKE
jgi:hypothetical protein